MENKEPSFVPEWLRGNGNGSTKARQSTTSFANSDDRIGSNSRNVSSTRLYRYTGTGRNYVPAGTTSEYFRRDSKSRGNSSSRSSGSYDRSSRDTEWDKDKLNSRHKDNGSHSRREYSYTSGNRFDKDSRRSNSSFNEKQSETWLKKGSEDIINSDKSTNKASFQRDFPSLGSESSQGAHETRRVTTSNLTALINSLPNKRWTSALAEVPGLAEKNNGGSSPPQTSINSDGPSTTDTSTPSPRSVSSPPQLTTETCKVEEQAVKQCRQLVAMPSSMPKTLVHSASETLKPKVGHSIRMTLPSPNTSIRSSTPWVTVEQEPVLALEKEPSVQIKSRNEFFNSMRMKSLESPDIVNDVDSSLSETFVGVALVEKNKETKNEDKPSYVMEKSVSECEKESPRFKTFSYSEEKEAAFLQSLGWEKPEEEEEEEGGLTMEEINSFFRDLNEQIKSSPSSVSLQRMQLRFSGVLDNHTGSFLNACVPPGASLSTNSKLES